MRSLLALVFAAFVAACSTTPPSPAIDNYVATGFAPPAAGSLLVLLPVNHADDMRKGAEIMTEQVRRHLVAAGFRVAVLDKVNYDTVWSQEIQAAGGIFDQATGALKPTAYAEALSSLARRVCSEAKCAATLQPRLVLRSAKLQGASAEWDGQIRRVPVLGISGAGDATFSGSTRGLSVELTVVQADGTIAVRTYGGALLPYLTNFTKELNEVRPDLFAEDHEVADGVRLALHPLLHSSVRR